MMLDELVGRQQALDRAEWQFLLDNVTAQHWADHRDELLELAERLLRRGFARDAFDLLPPPADELDVRVERLRAFAMLNTGAPRSAASLLRRLVEAGHHDPETLGFLGRSEKDLARRATTHAARAAHQRRSLDYYVEAFERSGQPYPGINAASLAARSGRLQEGRTIAAQVEAACEKTEPDYWTWATLGEAYLILDRLEAAADAYRQFANAHRGDHSALASSRRQAVELLAGLGHDPTVLQGIFPIPQVVMFAGHRADAPDRVEPRLRPEDFGPVQRSLVAALREQGVDVGYAAAANGADILFLEALQELGAEAHIVLPVDVDTFKRDSVMDVGDPSWAGRFDSVISECASLTITSEGTDLADPESLIYGNLVMLGLARLKSEELAGQLSVFSVWDGESGDSGGTGDTLARCQAMGLPITVLSPQGERVKQARIPERAESKNRRETMSLLFADVVGYSQFTEREIEIYYQQLLVQIAELSNRDEFKLLTRETFGDSFYFVTRELTLAAELALALQELFDHSDALQHFSRRPKLRIALHAGPLLACYDPIAERAVYTGRHTSKAARVEPVADDNQILATQQFAALLALQAPQTYELAYAGERVLPKGYGTERLFEVSRWLE